MCNWGGYSALEAAGTDKTAYAPNVRLIRLMCLGRVHVGLILKAFELGADGVMLLGCASGNCRYEFGIESARESVAEAKKILNLLGMGSKRVHLIEAPPGAGDFAVRRMSTFVKRTRGLGPSPVKYVPKQVELMWDLQVSTEEV